jgi:thiamine-phosphate pyrophosphorylase
MASRSEAWALARAAATLGRRARRGKRPERAPPGPRPLPDLWFVTDPARTPDPVAVAETLPRGAGVIFRAFGARDAEAVGRALAATARRRGLVLLAGADPDLARRIGAHGVHLPQRLARLAPRIRQRHPHWLITGAAHDARAVLAAERLGWDAILLSPVFPSRSPSAVRPLCLMRFARLAALARPPVYALGGVNGTTARRLSTTRAAGLAAVDGLTTLPHNGHDSTAEAETA